MKGRFSARHVRNKSAARKAMRTRLASLPFSSSLSRSSASPVVARQLRPMSSKRTSSLLITPSTLASALSTDDHQFRVLDATWFMPNVKRDPVKEFNEGRRIRGATGHWSVDDVADKSHKLKLPHMMPSSETFAQACGKAKRDSQAPLPAAVDGRYT